MVIVYHGTVESIKDDLASVQSVLDERYMEVLGRDRCEKVKDTVARTLDENSYANSKEEYRNKFGVEIRDDAPFRFGIGTASPLKVNKEGNIKESKVGTAPLFYGSDEAFKHSGYSKITDRPLASFIHEFNHFVFYALQQPPLYLANAFIRNFLGTHTNKPYSIIDSFGKIASDKSDLETKLKILFVASNAQLMQEFYENSTKILDSQIMSGIGIDVPLPWRGQERQYLTIQLPDGPMVGFGAGGDCFKGFNDMEIINKFIDWPNFLSQKIEAYNSNGLVGEPPQAEYVRNLVDSLKDLRVTRMKFKEMDRLSKRKGNRKKGNKSN
jgi:hypothetical protein